jgi:hypothetical protein
MFILINDISAKNILTYIKMGSKFWLEDFGILFRNSTILPNAGMSTVERLNTLTRLVILISIILLLLKWKGWWMFLIFGLLIIIMMYYKDGRDEDKGDYFENYRCHRPATNRSKYRSRVF